MTRKDKNRDKSRKPATKAEPLKDADLDKVAGGVWGLESNFVKGQTGDSNVAQSSSNNGGKTPAK